MTIWSSSIFSCRFKDHFLYIILLWSKLVWQNHLIQSRLQYFECLVWDVCLKLNKTENFVQVSSYSVCFIKVILTCILLFILESCMGTGNYPHPDKMLKIIWTQQSGEKILDGNVSTQEEPSAEHQHPNEFE